MNDLQLCTASKWRDVIKDCLNETTNIFLWTPKCVNGDRDFSKIDIKGGTSCLKGV